MNSTEKTRATPAMPTSRTIRPRVMARPSAIRHLIWAMAENA